MIRAIFATIALAVTALVSPNVTLRAFAGASAVTLQGTVTDQAGTPLPQAFVTVGTTVQTNTEGRYSVPVQPAKDLSATLWAPGYQEERIQIQLPGNAGAGANVTFNFSGQFALTNALVNHAAHARLLGLPTAIPARRHVLEIHGTARVPLEPEISVTLPGGRVAAYPLTIHGITFAARLPLESKGMYRVEVNASSGFAVFNVPVFHGVAPFAPADRIVAPDPPHATRQQLAAFTLHLVNIARRHARLAPLRAAQALVRAARGHDADMVAHNYFLEHPHIGSNGSSPWQRVTKLDPKAREVGETVGEAPTAGQAVAGLLDSPEHRAILLGNFHYAGVAITPVSGGWLMTIDFT
jgi:uncharacterized protein YkwD